MKKFVRQILKKKGHEVWTVPPETPVFDALEVMAEKNIGALVVLADDKIIGVFSERDYARKVVLVGRHTADVKVEDIMTTEVSCVGLETSVDECMELMTDKRIRHLPVLDDGRLVGLISIGDVVKEIISHQESKIRHLESYITGTS